EYFAAMRGVPNLLVGVEDGNYYTLHRDLFRKTFKDRERMVGMLKELESQIQLLKPRVFSRDLRHFDVKHRAFREGKMSYARYLSYLSDQAKALGMELQSPSPESIETVSYLVMQDKAKTQQEKDLLFVEHDLVLLLKVADLQATEKEVKSFG